MPLEHPEASAEELYAIYAPKYTTSSPINRVLLDRFYAHIGAILGRLEPNDRLLEVGCGTGMSSLRIQSMLARQALPGVQFEVSDYDNRYIEIFKGRNFPIPFRQESVMALERGDRSFDLVFLLEVLEHLEDYRRALSEIFRVSRKYVVVSTPNEPLWRILNMARGKYWKDLGNTYGHVNHWSRSSLVKLVAEYGQILEVHTPIPWTIVVAKVKG